MSNLEPYGDFTMAGITDPFFKWLTNEPTPEFADGDVESPSGWFALVRVESDDFENYFVATGDDPPAPYVRIGYWYLVQIGSDGIVWTHSFEGLDGRRLPSQQRRRGLAGFSWLTRQYNQWLG